MHWQISYAQESRARTLQLAFLTIRLVIDDGSW